MSCVMNFKLTIFFCQFSINHNIWSFNSYYLTLTGSTQPPHYQSTDNYQFFVWDAVVLLKLLRMKVYCLSLLNSFEMTCNPLSADWLLEFDRLLNRRDFARWLLPETCPSSSLSPWPSSSSSLWAITLFAFTGKDPRWYTLFSDF